MFMVHQAAYRMIQELSLENQRTDNPVKLAVLPMVVQSPPSSSILGHGTCIRSCWIRMHMRKKCLIKQ